MGKRHSFGNCRKYNGEGAAHAVSVTTAEQRDRQMSGDRFTRRDFARRTAEVLSGSFAMTLDRAAHQRPRPQSPAHFNSAGASLMPGPVLNAVQRHLRLESEIGGYEAADAQAAALEHTYTSRDVAEPSWRCCRATTTARFRSTRCARHGREGASRSWALLTFRRRVRWLTLWKRWVH
jgi:hypothetical protein